MTEKASAKVLDFTNVKERSDVNSRRVRAKSYKARVVGVSDAQIQKGANKGSDQWRFVIELQYDGPSATYAYYCQLTESMMWKVRNLALAAGMTVPKKRIKLDPNKLVGKLIGVDMEDDDYEGRERSKIVNVFPASEVDGSDDDDEEEYDDDEAEQGTPDDDEDDEEEAPAQKVKRSRSNSEDEVTEDDLEELEIDDL